MFWFLAPFCHWLKAESRYFDIISASWTDKHISILHVYFQVIIASHQYSTPSQGKIQFNIHLVIFASSWNVAPFQMKWEIPFVPLSSDLWILGRPAAINTGDPLHSRALAHSRAPLFTQPCPHCSHSRAPAEQWARLCVFTLQGCVQAARLCRGSPVINHKDAD